MRLRMRKVKLVHRNFCLLYCVCYDIFSLRLFNVAHNPYAFKCFWAMVLRIHMNLYVVRLQINGLNSLRLNILIYTDIYIYIYIYVALPVTSMGSSHIHCSA